jgi:CPA2 family monovalent cation:H+ antiporter-2
MESALHNYDDILVVLGAAGIVIPLFRRLGISSVIGFLILGILIGPNVLGLLIPRYPWLENFTISDKEEIGKLAELGIAFLLFTIGLELSFERLFTLRRLLLGFGALQVILSSVALGAFLYALGLSSTESVILGAALSLSSTAIVLPILSEDKRLNSPTGRRAFAILLFQDLAVIPILLMVRIIGGQSDGFGALGIALALGQGILGIAVIVVVGRYLLRPFLRMVADTRSADLFMAATLFIAVGTGVAATFAGLSMAMGAFMAGLLLAETEYRREIETIVEPFRGLMLGAFFLLIGMGIDLPEVLAHPLTIVGLAVALVLIKATVLIGLGPVMRVSPRHMIETAFLLGPAGEFAFVVLASARAFDALSPYVNQAALVVVSLSMFTLPLVERLGRRLAKQLSPKAPLPPEALEAPPADGEGRVIVIGFGRVGQLIAAMLDENAIPYIAIDADPELVARERRRGKPIFYGDAARPEYLKACGIEEAKALALTVNSSSAADHIVAAARRERADVRIIARARDEKHAMHLYEIGASEAVPETVEAALQLGEAVLIEAGIPMGLAIACVHERRDGVRKLLGLPNRRAEVARLKLRRAPSALRADKEA